MNRNERGFTIIELMFAVGIVGVLAAIALPVYFDYTTRAKVSEGFALADRVKTGVTETYLMSPGWKESNSEYGLSDPEEIRGEYVTGVEAILDTITITYTGVGRGVPDGSTVQLVGTPTQGSVAWACKSDNIKSKYLPAICR